MSKKTKKKMRTDKIWPGWEFETSLWQQLTCNFSHALKARATFLTASKPFINSHDLPSSYIPTENREGQEMRTHSKGVTMEDMHMGEFWKYSAQGRNLLQLRLRYAGLISSWISGSTAHIVSGKYGEYRESISWSLILKIIQICSFSLEDYWCL